MKYLFFFLIVFFFSAGNIFSQEMTPGDYVAKYKDLAIREMKRMGVPAAMSLAQGLLETENGNSDLVKKSNNHFGIKCKGTWNAETVSHDDDEQGECFRSYKSAEDSYRDHSNFLRGSPRYAFLFKLDPRDYKGWAYGLKKAGYATNPNYPDILIKYIEDNNLEQYTLEAVNEVPVFDASKYRDDPEEKAVSADTNMAVPNIPADENNLSSEKGIVFINGSKAVRIPKGTSLLAVATQNNINLNRLLQINDLNKDGLLDKDQYIFLEKKQKSGAWDYYVVQQNETLYDVAQKKGVVLQSLCDYNNILPNAPLKPGEKILLHALVNGSVDNKPIDGSGQGLEIEKLHEVQPQESLYAISKKYNVSIGDLKEWNHLRDDNLKIGQQLIISK
jgi:LysM repeat protein